MIRLILILISALTTQLSNAEEVVFDGIPSSMTISSYQRSDLEGIPADSTLKWRCRIVKENDTYYWASNNNRELIYVPGSEISYFYAKEGGGYIKVMDGNLSGRNVPYTYSEAFEQYDELRVFWGISEAFSP